MCVCVCVCVWCVCVCVIPCLVAASIVSVLLNHGAAANVVNKRTELPRQCAQSRKVRGEGR